MIAFLLAVNVSLGYLLMSQAKKSIITLMRRHILIAEDVEMTREMLGDLLDEDYEVYYAADGVEALQDRRFCGRRDGRKGEPQVWGVSLRPAGNRYRGALCLCKDCRR